MRELRAGLWHWEAPHPDWEPTEPWSQEVSSYAIDDGERLLLFDPLGVPAEIEELVAERELAIVLTSPWHERDTEDLVERFDAPVFTPSPDTREDLLEKFEFEAPEGWTSTDLAWLMSGKAGEVRVYAAGDQLPGGSRRFAVGAGTTSCSGSKVTAPSSPVTRSRTSAAGSRSTSGGSAET